MISPANDEDAILESHIVPYDKRLVAFIDLQGFKDDIVKNYSAEAIGSLFGVFASLKKTYEKDKSDLQVTIISDSIVISINMANPYNLIYFFDACSFYANPRFCERFIAIRGGIALGDLHHADNIVYGPALLEAYNISEGKQKCPFLHLRMTSEVFHEINNLPQTGYFCKTVLFPEDAENKYYFFNPWLVHFSIARMNGSKKEREVFSNVILYLKQHVAWCVLNIAEQKTDSSEQAALICDKYKDLLIQTIRTFQIIKEFYYELLPKPSRNVVDFYSNEKVVLPFVQQMEQNFIEKFFTT